MKTTATLLYLPDACKSGAQSLRPETEIALPLGSMPFGSTQKQLTGGYAAGSSIGGV